MSLLPRLSLCLVLFVVSIGFFRVPVQADGPDDNDPKKVKLIPPLGNDIPPQELKEIEAGLMTLRKAIDSIGKHELLPDVEIYEKAVHWALDFKEIYDSKGAMPGSNLKKVLNEGLSRAQSLQKGITPWTTQTGSVLRGYRSKIDRSVQPYWMIVPKDYDFSATTLHRLDFWWHGRGETLSEANFMARSPNADGIIPAAGALILHPYGRYCNANKFAGEIDTLECLDHARKNYRIDPQKLLARGFSMGGAACWQFAVHFPTLWCAAAPGAGFSETPEFLNVFQNEKVEPNWYEKKLWHLYNATDYAQNIFNLPTVAYSGEVDRQKQAADVMAREMKKVGLELKHIIGPKTAHSYEKAAKLELNKEIDEIVGRRKPISPQEIKFVTYTLRYNQCAWLTIEGMEKHWTEAKVVGRIDDGMVSLTTNNVSALSIEVAGGGSKMNKLRIDGQDSLILPPGGSVANFIKQDGKWILADSNRARTLLKRHGLQGPIDDAFMDSFLAVMPSGKPMNTQTGEWVEEELQHARNHWRKQFRGIYPEKKDVEITDEDITKNNLILWGDPKSNSILAKIADKLPIKWNETTMTMGDKRFDSATHVPILIYPNPLNPSKYIVLNSGFTFREYDYLNNARQVPRLPDYAVVDVRTPPSSRYPGEVVRAGFFNEKWELQANDGR